MKTTIAELKTKLEGLPDDLEVRVMIPCRIANNYTDVEKRIITARPYASRMIFLLETEILDLGPK